MPQKPPGATLPWRVMLIAAIGERLRPEERAIFNATWSLASDDPGPIWWGARGCGLDTPTRH
jgi:hypothetical protein